VLSLDVKYQLAAFGSLTVGVIGAGRKSGMLRLPSTLCDHRLSSTFSSPSHFNLTHNTATEKEYSSDLPWTTTQAHIAGEHVPARSDAADAADSQRRSSSMSTPPRPPSRRGPNPFLLLGLAVFGTVSFLVLTERRQQSQTSRDRPKAFHNPLLPPLDAEKVDQMPRRPVE
jgi:hypothetical protein